MSGLWRYNWLVRSGYTAIVCDIHPKWVDFNPPYTNILMAKGTRRKTVRLIGVWNLAALKPLKRRMRKTL